MKKIFSHIINDGTAIIAIGLALRVVFKALGANPLAMIVSFVYSFTNILIQPVDYIFPNFNISGVEVDIIAITAMVFYGALYLLIIKIFKALSGE